MKKHCISINSKDFIALKEATGLPTHQLELAIYKFQGEDIDKWPTTDDILKGQSVNYSLKIVNALLSPKAEETWKKGKKNNWPVWKILEALGIPKLQQELIPQDKIFYTARDLAVDILANYSYTVEVNTANQKLTDKYDLGYERSFSFEGKTYEADDYTKEYWYDKPFEDRVYITKSEYDNALERWQKSSFIPSSYYSSRTVPGGINYTENEIVTPAITPSIKGHAQFSTDNGIGWFRSDEQIQQEGIDKLKLDKNKPLDFDNITNDKVDTIGSKTRRILEVQSDLFQKGRDNPLLTEKLGEETELGTEVLDSKENQFLQLLNKDNNWVTFFIKSIIQDTAKQTVTEVQESDVEAKVRELENSGLLKINCP